MRPIWHVYIESMHLHVLRMFFPVRAFTRNGPRRKVARIIERLPLRIAVGRAEREQ